MQVVTEAWLEKIGDGKWCDKIRNACLDLATEISEFAAQTNRYNFDRANIDGILQSTSSARHRYAKQFGTLEVHVRNVIGELTDVDEKLVDSTAQAEVDVKALFPKPSRGKAKAKSLTNEYTAPTAHGDQEADGAASTTPAAAPTRAGKTGNKAKEKKKGQDNADKGADRKGKKAKAKAAAARKRPTAKPNPKEAKGPVVTDDDSDDNPLADA
eukprot:5166693-Pyramimonas_sp.AAC.1